MRANAFRRIARAATVSVCVAMFGQTATAAEAPATVFAAASLNTALDEIGALYEQAGGAPPRLAYASSAALARQISFGAPADLVILANAAWMDSLEADGAIIPESRVDLLSNRLVVIATGDDAPALDLADAPTLIERLGDGRLALGLTEAAPVGIYAREALVSLGLWDAVATRTAETDNARAALALVAAGAAPLGVVYETDAGVEDRVSVVARISPDAHAPIVYPAAIVAAGDAAAARTFLAFLKGDAARAAFGRAGFGVHDARGDAAE